MSWKNLTSRDERKKPAQAAIRASVPVTEGRVTNCKVDEDRLDLEAGEVWVAGDVLVPDRDRPVRGRPIYKELGRWEVRVRFAGPIGVEILESRQAAQTENERRRQAWARRSS